MIWEASKIKGTPSTLTLKEKLRGERWTLEEGDGPIIAVALHDGHNVRDDVARNMLISEQDR